MNPAVGISTAGVAEVVAAPGGVLIHREEAQLQFVAAAFAHFGAWPHPPPLHMHASLLQPGYISSV